MRTLDRYILREVLGPLALGILVFSFLLITDLLFDIADIIVRGGVPAALIGRIVLTHLPSIIVLTIPMSCLFGIMIAVGRLSADSELVAMRACGISLFKLYRPVLLLSLLLTAVNLYLANNVLPKANLETGRVFEEVALASPADLIKPGVFFEKIAGQILFAFDRKQNSDVLEGVFFTDSTPGPVQTITLAKSGVIEVDKEHGKIHFDLQDTNQYEINLNQPEKENHTSALSSRFNRDATELLGGGGAVVPRDRHMMSWNELWERAHDRDVAVSVPARVELHNRVAIPVASLVFGLFAVPLGFSNRRGGRGSGFALSIGVILLYYVLITNGESAAVQGATVFGHRIPIWFAMWHPNMLFVVVGSFLLARRNRDKSLFLGRLDRWLHFETWKRLLLLRKGQRRERPAAERRLVAHGLLRGSGTRTGVVLRIRRPSLPFPNTLDRYVLRVFLQVFLIVLGAGSSIYIVANFTDLAKFVIRNRVERNVVLDYYGFLSFQIVHQILPFVVLITTLVAFGLLSRTNEITVAKALGISLFRLAVPVVLAGVLVAGCDTALESSILPGTNARAAELRAKIKGVEGIRSVRRADQQWFYGDDGTIYNYQYFHPREQTLQGLYAFRIDPKTYELQAMLFAPEARFENGQWLVSKGSWLRLYQGGVPFRYLDEWSPVPLSESPEFFDSEIKQPDQMTRAELSAYVQRLTQSGKAVPELEVELYNKIAMPIVCLVMALVALPFAFRLGRRGALYGIGIALSLGIVFYAVIAFFTTLGQAGALPPIVAAWSPAVIFSSLSLYVFLGVRS